MFSLTPIVRRLSFPLALVLTACGAATSPTEPTADPTTTGTESAADAKIRATLERFLNDPKKGQDARAIINFVGETESVKVVFRESILSAEGSTPEIDQLMLVAFTAGSVRAQLDARKKEDMPLAGVQAMVRAYTRLKEKDASLNIAKFEDYVARDEAGTLAQHVSELVAR